jgi:hypothetical protein
METKNLGFVKSIFRQTTSPVRTDVLWFDTINNVLRYWDTSALIWKVLTTSAYTQITCPANVTTSIYIGSIASTIGVFGVCAGQRGVTGRTSGFFWTALLDTDIDPLPIIPSSNSDSVDVSFAIARGEDGNYYWQVAVGNSTTDPFYFTYRLEPQLLLDVPTYSPPA